MRRSFLLVLAALVLPLQAEESPTLEAPTSPFDFDNYRRTPIQARQISSSWASRDNQDLQRDLISGKRGEERSIAVQAAALFEDPETISTRWEPDPLPSRNELTDQITADNYGETSKGQRDLLARARVDDDLKITTLSQSDYELLAARRMAETKAVHADTESAPLRPMPSLINSKTGGPPHGYAVSQAGVGARSEPRDNQNPFEDWLRALRLESPITKGTNVLPSPPARLAAATGTPSIPSAVENPSPTAEVPVDSAETKP